MVKTDHILFIASGAFHLSKPSDLIPELQGRLPIRVELSAHAGAVPAHPHGTEGVAHRPVHGAPRNRGRDPRIQEDAIARIAEIAFEVNARTENIGARRLHTVMERLLEEVSFSADRLGDAPCRIDAARVDETERPGREDLSLHTLSVESHTRSLSMSDAPTDLRLRRQSRLLEITWPAARATN